MPAEARDLVGFWLNCSVTAPRTRMSTRALSGRRPNGYWGETRRELIAQVVGKIKHWRVLHASYDQVYSDLPCTWFIDPPYQGAGKSYVHGSAEINYVHLGEWCRLLKGQKIVCENTGASWLPFRHLVSSFSSNRLDRSNHEAVWIE